MRLLNSAGIAQLVERNLAKVEVASSNLVSRSIIKTSALPGFFIVEKCSCIFDTPAIHGGRSK